MDRMKTFLIYALCIILFFIFSEFIINVGLNSMYKDMECKSSIDQVNVQQAQATLVNGRIKGSIKNSENKDLNGKYVKIDIYSERDVLLGTKYYEIQNLSNSESTSFELYFKAQYAKYYEVSITDTKKEEKFELEFLQKDLSKPEIILGTAIILILLF